MFRVRGCPLPLPLEDAPPGVPAWIEPGQSARPVFPAGVRAREELLRGFHDLLLDLCWA